MDDQGDIHSPTGEDSQIQSAVLQYVLSLHPAQTSFDDLQREFVQEPGDFGQRDALERAVRELSSAGLLQRNGRLLLPTRAAIRLDELFEN